ncbi:hypothetical protein FWG86_00780 [Candidatus Saccharibacteria bacterium]|nr:hypothetical protein [Candidatus Saccharibacteria bacterium]
MFLEPSADLPQIAAQFATTVFFGQPDALLRSFNRSLSQIQPQPRVLIFEKDSKKAGLTIDLAQELVRQNIALPASTPEHPNFLIIKNAELLNQNAGSALLKTLEEARQHFVLLARPDAGLLPTILSRAALFYVPSDQKPSATAEKLAAAFLAAGQPGAKVADLAAALDKKPDLALEVLNLLARAPAAPSLQQLAAAARQIALGNHVKLALLSYL